MGEVDLADLDPDAWRAQIAWVPQRPHLFARSIADNVRLGRPDATDDALRAAVADAGLDDVVTRLPAGLDTILGHEGGGLSRGERQRVALARAFVRDAPLAAARRAHGEPRRPDRGERAGRGQSPDGRAHSSDGRTPAISACHSRPGDPPRPSSDGCLVRSDADAPLGRTLAITRPAAGRMMLTALLGAGAIAADIGLIGTAAWLISKAAQHPNESQLAVAIVAVQVFGLSWGFFRYGERLVGHDAAFRLLTDLRVDVYKRLERLAPAGLPSFQRGDLLARVVQDVDSLQDLVIRVVPPFASAVLVGILTVALMWWMLPAAAVVLAVGLVLAATVVPWLTGALARRRESSFARVRGDLSAAMVDLTEGAAELIAFGAADAEVQTIRRQDAELTSISSASAGTAGIGLALTTLLAGLASWGCLMVGIPAVISGRLDSTELAVITLIPLATFELVAGLPVATQALQRTRQAAARVFDVMDTPPAVAEPEAPSPLPEPPFDLEVCSVWAGYPGAAGPLCGGSTCLCPRGGVWRSWARAAPANRLWPRYSSGS